MDEEDYVSSVPSVVKFAFYDFNVENVKWLRTAKYATLCLLKEKVLHLPLQSK